MLLRYFVEGMGEGRGKMSRKEKDELLGLKRRACPNF